MVDGAGRSVSAKSLTMGVVGFAGGMFGLGDQHLWIALVVAAVLLAIVVVLAIAFNIRIEIDERAEEGHRHRELVVTRRPRRRPSSSQPASPVGRAHRRQPCWRRRRAHR
jgi:hypothetical protein